MATVIDALFPPQELRTVVHLGLGAGTLARWIAATRPRARQRAFELDRALVELVRRELPLPPGLRVGCADAAAGVASLRTAGADVVVGDAFIAGRTPEHLCSPAFAEDLRRVLRPAGAYVVNLTHDVAAQAAVLAEVWPRVALTAPVRGGRRAGNIVAVAGGDALDLTRLGPALGPEVRVSAARARERGRPASW